MKKILIVLLLILSFNVSFAQSENSVSGIIKNESGNPIPYVLIEGAESHTVSDLDGKFDISSDSAIDGLEFSNEYFIKVIKSKDEISSFMTIVMKDNPNNMIFITNSMRDLSEMVSENHYIEGTVVDVNGKPLGRTKIYITKINSFMAEFNVLVKKEESKENKDVALIARATEYYNYILDNTQKVNKKYLFPVDKNGKFKIKHLLPINKTYQIKFIDLSDDYKTINNTHNLKGKTTTLNIKMYKNCENTGGSFDADCLFPAWASESGKTSKREEIRGIYGKNQDEKGVLTIIPNIIDIILKFISPLVVVMFIFAGIRFIYAGSDEDNLNKAKDFFLYAAIGLAFIIMSYTLMKVVYFFLK